MNRSPGIARISRRLVLASGAGFLCGCATPNVATQIAPGAPAPTLAPDETYVAVGTIFMQATGFGAVYFSYAGNGPQPGSGNGRESKLFTTFVPSGKPGTESGPQLFKVKVGWVRLASVAFMTKTAMFRLFAMAQPNAINYLGDVVVNAGMFDLGVQVRHSPQTVAQIPTRYSAVASGFAVRTTLLTRI